MKKVYFYLLLMGLGVGVWFATSVRKVPPASLPEKGSPQPVTTDSFSIEEPPSNSIKGQILSKRGEVMWESRIATSAAEAITHETVQQGEALKTDRDSSIVVDFANLGRISLESNSEVSFIQTLPQSLVMQQKSGTATYEKTGDTPVSVRVLHMLVTVDQGSMTITFNEDFTIAVEVSEGVTRVAYNDLDYVSTVTPLSKDDVFIYNDDTREGTVE